MNPNYFYISFIFLWCYYRRCIYDKIKSIEFVDDPILGSQILDFTIDGKPSSTAVCAMVITTVFNLIFYNDEFKSLVIIIKNILKRKVKK